MVEQGRCTAGCGFFGNAQYEGMCSKCFKDSGKVLQAPTVTAPPTIEQPKELSPIVEDEAKEVKPDEVKSEKLETIAEPKPEVKAPEPTE
jgi:hypothetical protein